MRWVVGDTKMVPPDLQISAMSVPMACSVVGEGGMGEGDTFPWHAGRESHVEGDATDLRPVWSLVAQRWCHQTYRYAPSVLLFSWHAVLWWRESVTFSRHAFSGSHLDHRPVWWVVGGTEMVPPDLQLTAVRQGSHWHAVLWRRDGGSEREPSCRGHQSPPTIVVWSLVAQRWCHQTYS